MALESSIIQSLRCAGQAVAIHELAATVGTDTNNTANMQKLRNTLRGMVHKRQLLSRNGLDGILRYMLPGSPIARAASAPQPDANAPGTIPAEKPAATVNPDPIQTPTTKEGPSANEPAAPAVPAGDCGIAVGRLGSKTLLVFQALREGEWVDRGTLDFRTKLTSSEVLTGLIALRKRGLVVAQGKTSNMLWARTQTAETAATALPVRTQMLDAFDKADAIAAEIDAAVAKAEPTAIPSCARRDERSVIEADDARRYRRLMQNATISISIGAVSMRTECSPAAPGAKLLWDGAIDAILSLSSPQGMQSAPVAPSSAK